MGTQYYMLIASLPHLPHFPRAERLPINAERLRWRRGALDVPDGQDLALALDLLHFPRHTLAKTDAQVDAQYKRALGLIRSETLREFVDQEMGQRSVLAALRRKARKLPAPTGEDRCGVGRCDSLIRARWDRDDLGLTALFPWIPQAQALLAAGDALEMEKLMMEATWRRATQVAESSAFGFEAVFAYVFKWDIVRRWLSHNAEQAAARFSQMVDEVINEQSTSSTEGGSGRQVAAA